MSTKIYWGTRFRATRLQTVLDAVFEHSYDEMYKIVQQLLRDVSPEQVAEEIKARQKYFKFPDTPRNQQRARWSILENVLRESAKDHSDRNPYDYYSGWSLYLYRGYFYGWPWGFFNGAQWLWDRGLAECFYYQNQSDRPANFTQKAWDQRGKVWDKVTDLHRLQVEVINLSDYYTLAAMEKRFQEETNRKFPEPDPEPIAKIDPADF